MSTQDTGYAPKSWEFDEEVTRVFDDMLARSIPDYEGMRDLVTDIATAFARRNYTIVDLGCSRGEALSRVISDLERNRPLPNRPGWKTIDVGPYCEFIGAEISQPMAAAARQRLGERATILEWDLRNGYPPHNTGVSVTLCVLTLMFVPVNYRLHLLGQAAQTTIPEGAFILVEKVLGSNARIDDVLQANYHYLKGTHGYDPDAIERKRLSLEGVLVPLTAEWNESMLRSAGFSGVDCFWAWGPFRAWVAVK